MIWKQENENPKQIQWIYLPDWSSARTAAILSDFQMQVAETTTLSVRPTVKREKITVPVIISHMIRFTKPFLPM